MTDEQEDPQKEPAPKPLSPGAQRWGNIPGRINRFFGDEQHEVVEPKEITSEGITEQVRKTDDFDD